MGVHHIKRHTCIPNLITGTCECPTQAKIDEIKACKKAEIELLEASIVPEVETLQLDDGFVMAKKKQPKPSITPHRETIKQIAIMKAELREMGRMIHLTERGLVPYNVQLEHERKLEAQKAVATTNTLTVPTGPVKALRSRPTIS